jgi:hypothetical protein
LWSLLETSLQSLAAKPIASLRKQTNGFANLLRERMIGGTQFLR